jgi:hypothetical protein
VRLPQMERGPLEEPDPTLLAARHTGLANSRGLLLPGAFLVAISAKLLAALVLVDLRLSTFL